MGPRATIAGVKGSAVAARHAVARERAATVGLQLGMSRRTAVESLLDELGGLVGAAGAAVAYRVIRERAKPARGLETVRRCHGRLGDRRRQRGVWPRRERAS